MRIGILSDIHLGSHRRFGGPFVSGVNTRGRRTVEVFASALQRAEALGCWLVCVAGDLFDVSHPEPQLITLAQEALRSISVPVNIIGGNHDLDSTDAGDHALGPLAVLPNVSVWDQPCLVTYPGGIDVIYAPFQTGTPSQWLREVLEQFPGKPSTRQRILITHVGIADATTPAYLRTSGCLDLALLFDLCVAHKITLCASGDWHTRKMWGGETAEESYILQIGTLIPTGWNNPGMANYGTLAIWDTEEGDGIGDLTIEEIPGPRFLTAEPQDVIAQTEMLAKLITSSKSAGAAPLYLNLKVPQSQGSAAREMLTGWIKSGELAGGEVASGEDVEEATQAAAEGARSALSYDDAVASYLSTVPLVEGVDRAEVSEAVRGFLARGGA